MGIPVRYESKAKDSWDGKPGSSSLQINYIFWNDFLAVFATEASPPLCSASIPWAILLRRLPWPHAHKPSAYQLGSPEIVQAEGRSPQLQERTADCLPAGDCKAELAQKGKNPRVMEAGELRNQRNVFKPALGIRQMAEENLSVSWYLVILLGCGQLYKCSLFSKAGELIP